MKIDIPGWLESLIRRFVGTDRGNMIIAFAESGFGDAFNALKDVWPAIKSGNPERVRISVASFLEYLPEPVRTAIVKYVQTAGQFHDVKDASQ